jgi:hypothetical protein
MRGVHSIFLKLMTKDGPLCCVDQITPFSELWDRNGTDDPILRIVGQELYDMVSPGPENSPNVVGNGSSLVVAAINNE